MQTMKEWITYRILTPQAIAFLGLLLLTANFNSCKKPGELFEGIDQVIDWKVSWSKLNVSFRDARTGMLIGEDNFQQVSAEITGESADYVIDISGVQKAYYLSNHGYLTLGITPDPEMVNGAIRFNIVARADGFLPASQSITISDQGDFNLTVFLASIEQPPDGISIKTVENTGLVIDGVLRDELLVKTLNSEACIILPSGLKMVDDNGQFLEGTLDIRLVYYNNISDGALSTFPGGLITRVEKYGDVLDGTFFTAGLVSIEIFDQFGRKARYFEKSALKLIMTIPSGTFNPETQKEVAAGDQIPVQSYNPETGIWKYQQATTVSLGKRGDFEVETWIPHLSWWSFDWFKGNYCNNGVELLFRGDFGSCNTMTINGIIRKQADNTFLRHISLNVTQDSAVFVTNAPTGLPVYIEWLLDENCSNCFTDPAFNPLFIEDLCATTTYEVPLVCFKPNTVSVVIDVKGYCQDSPNLVVRPSFGVWHQESGAGCWRYAAMENGYAVICDTEPGKTYTIGTYFDDVWYQWEVVIDQDGEYNLEFELTSDVCTEFF